MMKIMMNTRTYNWKHTWNHRVSNHPIQQHGHTNFWYVCLLERVYFSYTTVSCQKGPTRHAYAWQIGPFWQYTMEYISTMYPINVLMVVLFCVLLGLQPVILVVVVAMVGDENDDDDDGNGGFNDDDDNDDGGGWGCGGDGSGSGGNCTP